MDLNQASVDQKHKQNEKRLNELAQKGVVLSSGDFVNMRLNILLDNALAEEERLKFEAQFELAVEAMIEELEKQVREIELSNGVAKPRLVIPKMPGEKS